jgi:hypothetical protein
MLLIPRLVSREIRAILKKLLVLVSLSRSCIRRNGEPVNKIGWTFRDALKEVTLGIGPNIPLFFGGRFFDIGAYIQEYDDSLT